MSHSFNFVILCRPRILPESPKDGKMKTYLECNLGEVTLHHHVLHKEPLPAGHLYTTAAGRQDLCNVRNVPDLLDTLIPAKSRRISQTLPRRVDIINARGYLFSRTERFITDGRKIKTILLFIIYVVCHHVKYDLQRDFLADFQCSTRSGDVVDSCFSTVSTITVFRK